MRASKAQKEFAQWLLNIGNGMGMDGRPANFVQIPDKYQEHCIDDIVEFCFPSDVIANPIMKSTKLFEAALLCPRNEDVSEINEKVMTKIPGNLHTLESIDQPMVENVRDTDDEFSNFKFDSNIESINNETPNGFPPHILNLKVFFTKNNFYDYFTIGWGSDYAITKS